jgi:hypothetical protein
MDLKGRQGLKSRHAFPYFKRFKSISVGLSFGIFIWKGFGTRLKLSFKNGWIPNLKIRNAVGGFINRNF